MPPLFQCTYCTGASVYPSTQDACSDCKQFVHVCKNCAKWHRYRTRVCFICYASRRPHLFKPACVQGCTLTPSCKCKSEKPQRSCVKKQTRNHGRFFWSCRKCTFLFMGQAFMHHRHVIYIEQSAADASITCTKNMPRCPLPINLVNNCLTESLTSHLCL